MSFWRDNVIQPALNHDVEMAIAEQQAILARDPTDAAAHFALGTIRHMQGQTELAIQHFQSATEHDAGSAAAHVSLGRIYAVQGQYELAWKHARAAESLGNRELVEMLERYPNLGKGQSLKDKG
jgi:tetratricopeptide (TPR) repeat protein